MDTGHSYTHPLAGDVGVPAGIRHDRREPAVRVAVGSEVIIAVLLIALFGAAFYAYQAFQRYSEIRGALEAAEKAVVYEPLSQEGDGSYKEEESGGRTRKVIDRVRGWRDRH